MKTIPLLLIPALLIASTQAETPAEPAKTTAGQTQPAAVAKADKEPLQPGKHPRLNYKTPKNAQAGTRKDGDGGSRGGGVKLPSLYVLAPNHTGLTTQAQPSLFWYQSGPASTHFELTIVEPKHPKPLLRVGADKSDARGIHRLSLARHNITLQPGVVYRWTIALVPDPANRSQDVIASGTIQRTEPDAQLRTALANSKGGQKAALFAEKGVWYDALESITTEIDAQPGSKELHLQRAGLLDKAGLKEAAAFERL